MHRQTGAFLQVGKRIADPVLFDTKRDAEFVCRAMAKASYR
jgi:hypothetical protein